MGSTSESSSTNWTRVAGGAGIISMVLVLADLALGTDKPISINSPVSTIASHMTNHSTQNVAAGAFSVVGVTLFLVYAAVVAHRLRAERDTAPLGLWLLATSTMFVVFAALDVVIATAVSFVGRQANLTAEPALTRLMFHLYNGLLMPGVAHIALSGYFAVFAVGAFKGVIRPRWLGWLCTVMAPIALLNGIVGLSTANGGNFPLAPVAIVTLLIVTVVNGFSMVRENSQVAALPSQVEMARPS